MSCCVSDGETAVAAVTKVDDAPLFAPVVDVDVLAGPGDTAWVDAPDADTSVPSELGRVAREQAPTARCVVVAGRHGHVSFLLDPAPVRIRVVDVAPPYPAKLVDQAQSLVAISDDIPPVELVADITDLTELAASRPAARYLLPCRGSGIVLTTPTDYLDERPPEADWVLVGCTRSREIHRWFYGRDAPTIDMCPRRLAGNTSEATLTKCCLLEEERYERTGRQVVVPWGASLGLIRSALVDLVSEEAAWLRG